jgi:hypothetical protein
LRLRKHACHCQGPRPGGSGKRQLADGLRWIRERAIAKAFGFDDATQPFDSIT